jgi:hypothetical protein
MNEDPPTPPADQVTPPDIVFRTLTPVFDYRIEGAEEFTHSGHCGDAGFCVRLRPCAVNMTHFTEITEYASPGIRQLLRDRHIHCPNNRMGIAEHMLTIDVTHRGGSIPDISGSTAESGRVPAAVLDALRLHSSAGLPSLENYVFRSPPRAHEGLMIGTSHSPPWLFSHVGYPSVLRECDFAACRATIDELIERQGRNSSTYDKVLSLSMNYHRVSFTLEDVGHAFLVVMVAFEAMFKKGGEDNASRAARRIGMLLGTTKRECQEIRREFFDDAAAGAFCRIRNGIAHGDVHLDPALVAARYRYLHRHVTQAIVALLLLPPSTLDETKDYYDEVTRIADSKFAALPST